MALMQDPPVAAEWSAQALRTSIPRLTEHRVKQKAVSVRNVIRQLGVLEK